MFGGGEDGVGWMCPCDLGTYFQFLGRDKVSQVPREHPRLLLSDTLSEQACIKFLFCPPGTHLLCDVIVTRVNAVPEQILSAAITAAEVAAVHELPAGVEGSSSGCRGPLRWVQTQAMGWVSTYYPRKEPGTHSKGAALTRSGEKSCLTFELMRSSANPL